MNAVIKRFFLLLVCSIGLFPLFTSCDKTEEELLESTEKNMDFEYKGTRSQGPLYALSIEYRAEPLGNSGSTVDPMRMHLVITSVVGMHYKIVMMPVAITNPIVMFVSPLGDGSGYDISWMMNEIHMRFISDGLDVTLQYTYGKTDFGNETGSSTNPDSSTELPSRPFPDTSSGTYIPTICENIHDVEKYLIPLLQENGIDLGRIRIYNGESTNSDSIIGASVVGGDIRLFPPFYKKMSKDQYSILWRKIYNIKYNVPVFIRLQPLNGGLDLIPTDEIKTYLQTFLLAAYRDLDYSMREQRVNSMTSTLLKMWYMYPPQYYLNEIKAYEAERFVNEDVSVSYHAEREFMYWLNKARYAVTLSNYKSMP